jgi:hypothetical protein
VAETTNLRLKLRAKVVRRSAKTFVTDVRKCARCGGNHRKVTFRPFARPPAVASLWAPCPRSGEPILLEVFETPDGPGAMLLPEGYKAALDRFQRSLLERWCIAATARKAVRRG